MTPSLSDELLSRFGDFVAEQIGLHFPKERWSDLERGLRQVAREAGMSNVESYAQRLLAGELDKKQIELLASELTVGETYFFRDDRSFDILGGKILPGLVRIKQNDEHHLRIWSAGCCTGEEPYSIAILLDRMLPELRSWNVTILGTDINSRFLRKAAEGIYTDWSFRGGPAWLKENYFRQTGRNRFEILPRIRKMVSFAYLNLAEDKFPTLSNNTNAMDVIFCRNVLMYFRTSRAKMVIQNLHHALTDGGWLVVSATETSSEQLLPFVPQNFEGAILYQKTNRPSRAPAPISIEPLSEPVLATEIVPPKPVLIAPEEFKLPVVGPQMVVDENDFYKEAAALFEQGNYSETIQKVRNSPASLESSPQMLALLARSCANLGELAEAREWVEKAIAADKVDPGMHYLHAVILHERGEMAEAVQSLKRVLYLAPDFVLAHFALGNHALRQDKFAEADKHFGNALALLNRYEPNEVLPDSDGLAAGRLREMIESTMAVEKEAWATI
jgi:chemotaxis protein methyltransferase CheR